MKLMETDIDTEEFQQLQTLTELMYTAKTLYRNVSELHSQICKLQDKSVLELSLDACLVFNKLYDTLQTEQKTLLNNIEIDISENI
jgi:hypothetical protein